MTSLPYACPDHDWQPDPHRVEFPHVPKVTKVREPHTPVLEYFKHLTRIEARHRKGIRTAVNEQQSHDPAEHCHQRNENHVVTPIGAADSVDQVRRCFSQSECADENSQGHSPRTPEPRCEYLHSGRIHPCQEHSCQKP